MTMWHICRHILAAIVQPAVLQFMYQYYKSMPPLHVASCRRCGWSKDGGAQAQRRNVLLRLLRLGKLYEPALLLLLRPFLISSYYTYYYRRLSEVFIEVVPYYTQYIIFKLGKGQKNDKMDKFDISFLHPGLWPAMKIHQKAICKQVPKSLIMHIDGFGLEVR